MSIQYAADAGAIVERNGDLGLVTGWHGERGDDNRECGVMMRIDKTGPFQQYWVPYKEFVRDFTLVGTIEDYAKQNR